LQLNCSFKFAHVEEIFTILSKTPLHYAAYQGHLEITKLLVETGADINMKQVRVEMLCFIVENWLIE
jgi:ankyrin repeat protein